MKFFNLAKRLARYSDYETHKLGAVIIQGNRIRGVGFNKKRTHPKSTTRFQNLHAELAAVLNSRSDDLSGCDIYVYREKKDGCLGMSRPCPHCYNLLTSLNINKIYYTVDNGYNFEKVG